MYNYKKTAAFVFLLLSVASCGQSDNAILNMSTKTDYSLCPKSESSRSDLFELMRDFANQHEARIVDRGAEAQRELSGMSRGNALASTGGDLIMLTVEKPNEFRISLSNLGLREKIGLTIRYWAGSEGDSRVKALMDDIERFWSIEAEEGGTMNDPPCGSIP